jgi:capsular polysaccharide export protein
LEGELSGLYYLVPLQVTNDAQITSHSKFKSPEDFINEVISSFARHAPHETMLVIKHHPLDRGYHNYAALIQQLSTKLNVEGRILYLHDQHLPTLLSHSKGVVVINSTVGFSAMHHQKPVKVMGQAFYNIADLAFQEELDRFWQEAERPDAFIYQKFLSNLIEKTQVNGSFYRRLPMKRYRSGLAWR